MENQGNLDEYLVLVAADAQSAWDSGRAFYAVRLSSVAGGEVSLVKFDVSSPQTQFAERQPGWELALEQITHVGWRLHTWAPVADRGDTIAIRTVNCLFAR